MAVVTPFYGIKKKENTRQENMASIFFYFLEKIVILMPFERIKVLDLKAN